MDGQKSRNIESPFDCIFTGWKETDRHPIFAGSSIPFPLDGAQFSGSSWYAPLRSMTDEEVWQATKDLYIPYNEAKYDRDEQAAAPDNTVACSRCLTGRGRVFCPDVGREIDAAEWDHDSTRQHFLNRFFGL